MLAHEQTGRGKEQMAQVDSSTNKNKYTRKVTSLYFTLNMLGQLDGQLNTKLYPQLIVSKIHINWFRNLNIKNEIRRSRTI